MAKSNRGHSKHGASHGIPPKGRGQSPRSNEGERSSKPTEKRERVQVSKSPNPTTNSPSQKSVPAERKKFGQDSGRTKKYGTSSNSTLDQLEGRNIIVEALRRKKRKVHQIWLDDRAKEDHKIAEIVSLAKKREIPCETVSRQFLDERSETGVHNGIIAMADPHPSHSTVEVLEAVYANGEQPFMVLVDELNYEQNLGAILRSSMGAGVHAVIIPDVRGKGLTPIVQRVAMGGAEAVPLVREGLFNSIKELKKAGIPIIGADMDGAPIWDLPLKGAVAFVFGGESKGLSPTIRKKCDYIASVPLHLDLESLNVSVTAGVFLFEKNRQERS